MKTKSTIIISTIFCMVITSCATTISTSVRRPAELDLGGAKTIAVLPFKENSYKSHDDFFAFDFEHLFFWFNSSDKRNEDIRKLSDRFSQCISNKIIESEFYDLISANTVQTALENGQSAPCDIYLTGFFSEFKNNMKEDKEKKIKKSERGEEIYYVTHYKREASIRISYDIIDSKTNKVLGTSNETISETSSSYDKRRDVPDAASLLGKKVETVANKLIRKIQPYYTTVSLQLLSDKTKDPLMKTANKLAKNGSIESSKQLFLQLYDEQHYMEAGYNAAILMRAQGSLEAAKTLMTEVAETSGNPKAYSALSEINSEIRSAERLRKQLEANAGDSTPSAVNAK